MTESCRVGRSRPMTLRIIVLRRDAKTKRNNTQKETTPVVRRTNPALKQFQNVNRAREEGNRKEKQGIWAMGNEHSVMKTSSEYFCFVKEYITC